MSVCQYCGHPYGTWHTCKGVQAAGPTSNRYQPGDRADLAVARSASQQVRDDTIRAECAQLREDNAHLRAKLEISQLALDHAITALGRTANRSQSPENSRRQA